MPSSCLYYINAIKKFVILLIEILTYAANGMMSCSRYAESKEIMAAD